MYHNQRWRNYCLEYDRRTAAPYTRRNAAWRCLSLALYEQERISQVFYIANIQYFDSSKLSRMSS